MKTKINILVFFILSLILTSCVDEYGKYGEPSSENFWRNESDALRAADGLYFWMGEDGIVGRGFMGYYNSSDDVVTGRTHAGYTASKNFIASYNIDAVDNWPIMYQLIKRCNDIILNVPKMNISDGVKNEVLGQAYFFRAWAYFWIAPYYGDNGINGGIPIVKEGLAIQEFDIPRTKSVRENYAYCIEDFKRAARMLPYFRELPTSEYGRPHKTACWAYIAKVALWDAQYDNKSYATTVTYCDSIIATGDHNLLSNFADVFKIESNYSDEYIFSFSSSANAGSMLPGILLENKGWGLYNGWGYFTPTTELVNTFESGDDRLGVTILQPGDSITFLGNKKIYYSTESASGMQFNKYMEPYKYADAKGKTINPNGDYPTTALNIPVIRYAEVLLMKAEALIAQGLNGDEPLNRVRIRAGLAPKNNATLEDLKKERRCELAGEFSHRMLDLLRWGDAEKYLETPLHGYKVKLKTGITIPKSKDDLDISVVEVWPARNFDPSVNYVFPIPANEISKSKNLKQNIGY